MLTLPSYVVVWSDYYKVDFSIDFISDVEYNVDIKRKGEHTMNNYLLYINGSLENSTNDYAKIWEWYRELIEVLPNVVIDLVDGSTGEVFQSNVDFD